MFVIPDARSVIRNPGIVERSVSALDSGLSLREPRNDDAGAAA